MSGIDPGWVNDLLPLLASGLCQEIEEIRSFEIFNYELYAQPDAVRYLVGFGQPLESVPPMVAPFSSCALTSGWPTAPSSVGSQSSCEMTSLISVPGLMTRGQRAKPGNLGGRKVGLEDEVNVHVKARCLW